MWTWVEPLYQPLASMSVMRRRSTVSSAKSPAPTSTATSSGQYSKPLTSVSSVRPAGTSTVNRPVWWNT